MQELERQRGAGAADEVSSSGSIYRKLIKRNLERFSTTFAEDGAELETANPPLSARRRLALLFRRSQKALLNRELSLSAQRGAHKSG